MRGPARVVRAFLFRYWHSSGSMADASHSPTVESQRVTGSQSPCTRELRLFVTLTAHMPTAPRRLSFYRHGSFLLWFQPPVVPTISRTQDHPSGSGTNDRPARGRLIRLFRDVLKTRKARRQGFLSYVNYKSWDCRGARTTAYYTMESSMESSILQPQHQESPPPLTTEHQWSVTLDTAQQLWS